MRARNGFTLIELMVTVVILGVLCAIAIPNFIRMQLRAKESTLKANMHAFQVAAEDYNVKDSGEEYATSASDVVALLPGSGSGFFNPFDQTTGSGNAWEDRPSVSAEPTSHAGITSYADSANGTTYNIKGRGEKTTLNLVLSAGR